MGHVTQARAFLQFSCHAESEREITGISGVPACHRGAARRVDAILGLHPRNHEMIDAELRKPGVEIRVVKRAGMALVDDGLVSSRSYANMMEPPW